jgi:hypothetical protein
MVSRRAGRTFSDLACGAGVEPVHHRVAAGGPAALLAARSSSAKARCNPSPPKIPAQTQIISLLRRLASAPDHPGISSMSSWYQLVSVRKCRRLPRPITWVVGGSGCPPRSMIRYSPARWARPVTVGAVVAEQRDPGARRGWDSGAPSSPDDSGRGFRVSPRSRGRWR